MVTWRVRIYNKIFLKRLIQDYLVQYDASYTAKDVEDEARHKYCLEHHSSGSNIEISVTKA